MPLSNNAHKKERGPHSSYLSKEDVQKPESRDKISGVFFINEGERKAQAKKYYEEAMQMDLSDEERKKQLEYALTLDPTLWDAWEWIGYYYEQRMFLDKDKKSIHLDEAINAYEHALEGKWDDPDFLEMLAMHYEANHQDDRAQELYKAARALPNY